MHRVFKLGAVTSSLAVESIQLKGLAGVLESTTDNYFALMARYTLHYYLQPAWSGSPMDDGRTTDAGAGVRECDLDFSHFLSSLKWLALGVRSLCTTALYESPTTSPSSPGNRGGGPGVGVPENDTP